MRDYCIVCGEKLYEQPIYEFHNMPSGAQNMPSLEELPYDKGIDLSLCQCKGCGLIQYNCEPVSYYKDSTRAGERSKVLIEMRRKQYSYLMNKFNLKGKKLLEVGAGKGGFLKTLKEMYGDEVQEYGIENNKEFVKYARAEGVNVVEGFMDNPEMILDDAPFDVFTSLAFLSRLTNPNDTLKCIYNNLTDNGIGLVMVPSLEHVLSKSGIYDICHDHIAYYDKRTLRFLLEKNGFDIIEDGEEGNTYLYAYVKKRNIINLNDKWHDNEKLNRSINKFVTEKSNSGEKLAVWCAGHYAFTVISLADIGSKISYIIDNAQSKQGRFAPASHIPITDKEIIIKENISTIIILGPLFFKEIYEEIHAMNLKNVTIAWIDNGLLKQTTI